jgi:hypothetical protein
MPSNLFDFTFRYFTFFACGIVILNLWIVRNKVSLAIKVYFALHAALFLIWGLLQIIGGYNTFFFVVLPPNHHPLVVFYWLLSFIYTWGVTAWVIWGDGANELSKSNSTIGDKKLRTPKDIKRSHIIESVLLPVLVALGYATGFFGKVVIALQIH